ncbi:MAG: serine/threonine protein kinase [Pirellula sp.]|jgi:hypothetical protein
MDEFEDEESDFSLGGLPAEFGNPSPKASDAGTFPVIPGYRITRLLGQGGMGAVYQAVSLDEPSQNVAIKTIFLPRFQTIAVATRKRFEREASLLGKLSHPNIVPILELGTYEREYQSVPYFTMPWLEQGDLSDALERQPIHSRDDLYKWVDSLCGMLDGLAVAHQSGIVHRDIKPRNLFVGSDGSLLLGDFGLAKIFQDDSELTSTIGRMGTTPYAPPEQLLSAKLADTRADIYAIGVILYQFACFGVRPFAPDSHSENTSSETDSIARWQRSTDRTAPRPSERLKHLSNRSFDFIVQKCLAYYPEHRYQTVDGLLCDLRAWRRGEIVQGTWQERFRTGIVAPMMAQLLPISIVGALLITSIATLAWYKFSSLSDNVISLEEDVGKERQKQFEALKKTESILREELNTILPKLQGEKQDYNVRRMVDPISEFSKLGERAKVIARDLSLATSSSFTDRHNYWVIHRTAVPPTLRDRTYVDHLRNLLDLTQDNLQHAQKTGNDSDQAIAVTDLIRTHRMLLSSAWSITEYKAQDDYREILDVDQVFPSSKSAMEALGELSIVKRTPALQRYLKLILLELDIRMPAVTPEQLVATCRARETDFSSTALKVDGCLDLHPWYVAWYIFEDYYETSTKLNRPAAERELIVTAWHELQTATPALEKDEGQNIVYLRDLITVNDRRGDVLRDLGYIAEAKVVYDANWSEFEPIRKFYNYDPYAWALSEQTLSSLINLAEKEGDREAQMLYFGREQKLLREKLAYDKSHPYVFSEKQVIDAQVDLAASLYWNARLLTTDDRKAMLEKAQSLTEDTLKSSPEHPQASGLQLSIRELLAQ